MGAGASQGSRGFVRGLGLVSAVALVVGNMVGTSVYTLPASLAQKCGPLSIVAWALTAAGYFFVARVFASLGPRHPRTSGPYVFVRAAFGDFAGFLVVWAYWFSTTVGNAAIVITAVSYVVGLMGREENVLLQFVLGQLFLWATCALNVFGLRSSARLQVVVMVLNVVPLLALSIAMLFYFDAHNLVPFAPQGMSALPGGMALVVWAYCGIESVTVPAEEVRGPERTIRLGTLLGYGVGTVVFLVATLAVHGALPSDVLAAATARPIAVAAERTLGSWAAGVISVTAIVAALGTLNGWTLILGRVPVAAAEDGLFFRPLARIHPRWHTPHVALLVGTAVASLMMFAVFQRTLLDSFNLIVSLSVLTMLFCYLMTAAAELHLCAGPEFTPAQRRSKRLMAAIAFLFLLFALYGIGPNSGEPNVGLYGFLAIVAGIPLYIFVRRPRP